MPRRIHLAPHLTEDELQKRYRAAADPVERSRWHFLWLLASGLTATAVAAMTGYSAYWIGQSARRYNRDGPDGVGDRRHSVRAQRPHLSDARLAELRHALAGPPPEGDRWCSIALNGATASASSTRAQAAPFSIWRRASRSRCSRQNWPPSPVRSAPVPPSRSCWSSIVPAGNPPAHAFGRPSTSTCSSCQP